MAASASRKADDNERERLPEGARRVSGDTFVYGILRLIGAGLPGVSESGNFSASATPVSVTGGGYRAVVSAIFTNGQHTSRQQQWAATMHGHAGDAAHGSVRLAHGDTRVVLEPTGPIAREQREEQEDALLVGG